MNGSISPKQIQSICTSLDIALAEARDTVNTINTKTISGHYGTDPYDFLDEQLEYFLTKAFRLTAIALEQLDLPRTRRQLTSDFRSFEKKGLSKTRFLPDFDSTECKPLECLQHYVDGIRLLSDTTESSLEQHERSRLEVLLRDTAVLTRKRGIAPRKEQDIQDVMNDYLSAAFPSYSTGFSIAGTLKNFKPDGGVRNLRTAIEFKFANSEQELNTALGGVFEDIAGYSGSDDWTRFYSVVYMTEPFKSEAAFGGDLKRAGATAWQAVLVNGSGQRKK